MRVFEPRPLAAAIRVALMAGIACLPAVSSPVVAQEADEDELKALDRVQVTGSRIRRTDIEGANPVTIIQREELVAFGRQDLGEVLKDLPMMSGSPQSTQRNNGGNGSVAVDIRGLGQRRTLLLINGHRLAPGGIDLSTIPSAMVERVEILKDGASAIYGADAVAGVVNIITRRDFEGAELEASFGEAFDEGGARYNVSFITGGNIERGNIVIGVQHQHQDAVFQDVYDKVYLNNSVTIYDPVDFETYGFSGEPWADQGGNGIGDWGTFGSSRIPYGRFDLRQWNPEATNWTICQDSQGGGSLTTDYGPRSFGGEPCGPAVYNFAPENYIQQPYDRTSMFFQADYELFEFVDAYLEGSFTSRQSEQLLAPLPYDSRFNPSYAQIEPGVVISKDNYYNPFGVDIVQWRRRMVEAGGRSFQQSRNAWRVVAGLTGDFGATWTWDVSYNYSSFTTGETEFGQFTGDRLALAMGPSFQDPSTGEVICGTPENPVYDCVSLNTFSNPDTNPITEEMVRYLQVPLARKEVSSRQVTTAMLTGDVFDLPAGPLSAAFGVQHRRDKIDAHRDSLEVVGQTTGNNLGGLVGNYEVSSIFWEFNVPVLAALPGAELLELGISGRWDDFSMFDSATTWHGTVRWKPVSTLLLRATAGQVYREPNISELFTGQAEFFQLGSDPCSGQGGEPGCEDVPPWFVQRDEEIRGVFGGNLNITPEEGDSLTLGLVWSPEFITGFSMTLDWWRIELEDAIVRQPLQAMVLNGCVSGLLPQFCERVHRFGPDTTFWGDIDYVDVTVQKVGPEAAEGLDFSFNYTRNTNIGLWNFSWWGSYNLAREQLVLKDPDGDGVTNAYIGDSVGLYEHRGANRLAAFPDYRWRLDTTWSLGNWSASVGVDFVKGITECGSPASDPYYLTMYCPDDAEFTSIDPADTYWGIPMEDRAWLNTIDDTIYVDVVGRYSVPGWSTELSLGIQNLTDEPLPFLNHFSSVSSDPNTYRAFGRSWFVRIRHNF